MSAKRDRVQIEIRAATEEMAWTIVRWLEARGVILPNPKRCADGTWRSAYPVKIEAFAEPAPALGAPR